ncbi:hypothetical protein EBR25_12915 [bacterium]|nr:hypothetical protein [bacterium]
MKSEAVYVGMEVEQISSSVQRHYRASRPVRGERVYYKIIPSELGCRIELTKQLSVELKVRSEPLWNSINLVGMLIGEQHVFV